MSDSSRHGLAWQQGTAALLWWAGRQLSGKERRLHLKCRPPGDRHPSQLQGGVREVCVGGEGTGIPSTCKRYLSFEHLSPTGKKAAPFTETAMAYARPSS